MVAKAPTIDTGTATLGTSVARHSRRNTNTTNMTSRTETASVHNVSSSEPRMVMERSTATVSSTSPGSALMRLGSSCFTASTASMMLAPGMRDNDDADGRLAVGDARVAQVLDRIDDLGHVGELDRRMVAIGDDEIAILRGFGGLIVGVDLIVEIGVSIWPLGELALAEASAARTSSSPTP